MEKELAWAQSLALSSEVLWNSVSEPFVWPLSVKFPQECGDSSSSH